MGALGYRKTLSDGSARDIAARRPSAEAAFTEIALICDSPAPRRFAFAAPPGPSRIWPVASQSFEEFSMRNACSSRLLVAHLVLGTAVARAEMPVGIHWFGGKDKSAAPQSAKGTGRKMPAFLTKMTSAPKQMVTSTKHLLTPKPEAQKNARRHGHSQSR